MKKIKLFFACAAMTFFSLGQVWAVEQELFNNTFPGRPSAYTESYTKSFTDTAATDDSYVLTYSKINNGKASDAWTAVRAGQKSYTSKATITSGQIAEAITKVTINFTMANSTLTNELYLLVADNSSFTGATKISKTIAVGEITFTIPSPAENMYYQIVLDMDKDGNTANGFNRFDKVAFYYDYTPTTPTIIAESAIDLGTKYFPAGNFQPIVFTIPVTGLNLTNAIEAYCSHPWVSLDGTLTKDGGQLTVTITAEYADNFSCTIDLTSDLGGGGQEMAVITITAVIAEVQEYTVAEAIDGATAATPTILTDDFIGVDGIITRISFKGTNFNTYGSAEIYLRDVNDDSQTWQFHNCYSTNGDRFTTSDPAWDPSNSNSANFNTLSDAKGFTIKVGDRVVAYGAYGVYNTTHQLGQGCFITRVVPKGEVTNIVLSGAPLQTEYEAGDAFLFDGLTATATYQNGTEEDVTATAEWSADPATIFSNVDVSVVASVGSISSSPELVPVTVKTHHVSFNSPQGGSLVVKCGGTPISDGDDFVKGTVLTVEATPAEGYNLQSLICTGATLEDGQLTVGTEEIEIAATFVAKAEPDLSWSAASATATIGATNSFPTLNNPHGLTVSYESTNESVATIDIEYGVLTVTLVSAGQTTIKAVFPGDNEYVSGSAEYLLTVEEPSTYTLTLHIQVLPNDGTPEADLFTAVTFDVFDNDDDPDHEFVKYDNSSNLVMSGTFTAGKVVNFENFSSEAYNFANWENDETQFYRGVTMNSDMEITMYVSKNVWTATIGVHDLNKGMVEIISAEPLYWADINDPSSTWRLRITATAIPGYKFLGWGEVDLEENLMNWYNAASLEEHFANLQAEYEEMVAMGESLTDPDGIAWRDLLGQRLSANAEFTAQQVYSYEEFEFNDPIGSYSLMAFFTEDTSTGCENVNADGVEAYKHLENGQLVIIKNGVRYNALGELMK